MPKYQILADLPGIKRGTIFESVEGESYYEPMGDLVYPKFHRSQVENNPSWWREVKKPKKWARAYVNYDKPDGAWVLSDRVFSSSEEAERYFGLPSKAISWPALTDSEGYYPGPKAE